METQQEEKCTQEVLNDPVELAGYIEEIGSHYELIFRSLHSTRTHSPLYASLLFQFKNVVVMRIADGLENMRNEQWKKTIIKENSNQQDG